MKDQEIINLYWNRQEIAITETAHKYGAYCHSISYNILHNEEDAEECVNDTYLGAWNAMPPHRPSRLAVFLGKITRNLSLNRFRAYTAKKRGMGQTELALGELEECIPGTFSVEADMEAAFLVQAINGFLHKQTKLKRNIFVRRYWYLSSIKEIAADYAMSESKVASLLFRMRNELKLHLEREGVNL